MTRGLMASINCPVFVSSGTVYTGPGDVVSGAVAWWGLRAYTLASIGANAVRLREDGGNTEQDFATIAGGGLNLTAISTFKGANNLFVVTLYDQVGSANLTQATAANQPKFILAGLGLLPVLRFVAATPLAVQELVARTQAQPFTISWIGKRTGNFAGFNSVAASNSGSVQTGFANSADSAFLYTGAVASAAAVDNAFHAVQSVFNGASSDLNIDGIINTLNPGAGGFAGIPFRFGDSGGNSFEGDGGEVGLWASAFSGANSTAMSANQRTYWGF